jgi:hypothetical protein
MAGVIQNGRMIQFFVTLPTDKTSASRIEALHYLRDHSTPQSIVASHRFTLHGADESYYLYSAFSERPMVSEGARYGSLLAAISEIVDSARGLHRIPLAMDTLAVRRAALDTIYYSADLESVRSALHRYHVQFILLDRELNQQLLIDPGAVADPFFSNRSMDIWRVRY